MIHREAQISAQGRMRNCKAQRFAQFDQHRHGRRIAARARDEYDGIARLDEALRDLARASGIRCTSAHEAELPRRGKDRALDALHRDLGRNAEVHRPARLARRHLQRAADHESCVVLHLQLVIPLHVLACDAVLIVGGARMVLRQRGEPEWSRVFNTQLVDQYKTVAHVPLGLYSMALPYADGPASDELRRKAGVYRDKTRAFSAVADQLEIPATQRPRQHAMFESSLAVLDKLIADGTILRRVLEAFARRMGPLQLANADLAAAVHLDNLAAATTEMRTRLKPGQWEKTYVLVTGSKMPRVGNLQYEYFVRNEIERRLLYTEGLTSPDTAAPLVGTLEIDRNIGQAFFADRYRMDRDLLADGARKHLDQMFGRSTSSPR